MDVITKFLDTYNYKFKAGVFNPKDKDDILLLERILDSLNFKEGLSASKLLTPYSNKNKFSDKGNYDTKYHRFVWKVDNEDPFELERGGTIIIDKAKSVENGFSFEEDGFSEMGKTKLVDKNGNKYTLGLLAKTPELGGEENTTAITESAQAIAVALRFDKGKPLVAEDITLPNFIKVLDDGDMYEQKATAPDVDRVLEYLKDGANKAWVTSIVNIGNSIAGSKYIKKGKNYKAHWQDQFVDSIYDVFSDIKKKDSSNKILMLMQDDKWNPADMWLSTNVGRLAIENLKNVNNITELNAEINRLFCEGEVVGISLKKTTKAPTIKEFNTDQCSMPQSITFKDYYFPKNGAEITVQFGKNKEKILKLRNFGGVTWSGEVGEKGAQAAAGKVGIDPLNAILDDHSLSNYKMPASSKVTKTNLSGDYITDLEIPTKENFDNETEFKKALDKWNDDTEKRKAQKKYKELYEEYKDAGDFIEKFDEMNPADKVALFYALHVIDVIKKESGSDPTLMSDIMRYAMSATLDTSSAFAKASQ